MLVPRHRNGIARVSIPMNIGLQLKSTTHWSLISQHRSETQGLKLQITSGMREYSPFFPIKS